MAKVRQLADLLLLVREVKNSSEKDKLFPKKVGQLLKQYLKSFEEYVDIINKQVEVDVDLSEVYPNPMRKLFLKKNLRGVYELFKDMESYSKDNGKNNPEKTAFLGVIILFYFVIVKNLLFVGVSPLLFKGVSVELPLEFDELGISKRSLMKLIPVLDYIDKDVGELIQNDISKKDINYFHVIFKRLVNAEV